MRTTVTTAGRVPRLFPSQTLGFGYRAQPFSARQFFLPHIRPKSSAAQSRHSPSVLGNGVLAFGIGLGVSAGLLLNHRTVDADSPTYDPTSKRKLATITQPEQLIHNTTVTPTTRASKGDTRQTLEPLDSEGITRVLSRHEESYRVDRGRGVVRFDLTQVPSNDPLEDDHSEAILEAPGLNAIGSTGDWMFWGIYDGHSYGLAR
jgi:hypothetical protein